MKSESSLFTAAIESAEIYNHAVREVAHTSGLLLALDQFHTVDDVIRKMGFRTERAEQVWHLLRILVATGEVEERTFANTPVYRAVGRPASSAPERYRPNYDHLTPWYGERHAELIRNGNKQVLGDDLSFLRSSTAALEFNREYERAWRTNLENPLYEFGRMACVRELVTRGNRFLDLASGPGYGALRLAEFSDQPCSIVCVDKSHDFLTMARHNVYPQANVSFIERDLNTGLPPLLPHSFDGVLFNGAFHFMEDKPARLREMWRSLRPGGLLALGHCYSFSGFNDEAMHNFLFSLVADPSYILPWSTLKEMVREVGFEIYREFYRGSHSYLLAERPVTAADEAPVSALDGITGELRGGSI